MKLLNLLNTKFKTNPNIKICALAKLASACLGATYPFENIKTKKLHLLQ